MVAIAVSSEKARVNQTIRDEKLTYPVYLPEGPLSSIYRVDSLPTTYVVSPDGQIVASSVGYTPGWRMRQMISKARK